MEKILLVTDSASDIDQKIAKEYDINILPFKVTLSSGEEFEDGVSITPNMIYEILPNEMPKTSLPSIDKLTSLLDKAVSEGYTHAIIVTISNKFSGTYNATRLIAENYPELKICVFDSLSLTMGEGALILRAAQLIREGKSFDEVVDLLPKIRDNTDVYFTIDTLEYLKKGGRIGKVAGTIGEVLNLKPVITIDPDGTFRTCSKARGTKQSISKLISLLKPNLENHKCKVWIMDGNAPEKAKILFEAIKDFPNLIECNLGGTIGPALGINTGPGLVGFIVEKVD